MRCAT